MARLVSLQAQPPPQQYSGDAELERCSHFQISYHACSQRKAQVALASPGW